MNRLAPPCQVGNDVVVVGDCVYAPGYDTTDAFVLVGRKLADIGASNFIG